jgi:hypothetical protein
VARAKRTDRAEARRRNRATYAEPNAEGELEAAADDAAPGAPSTARAAGPRSPVAASAAPPPARRPGIMSAFSSSFRPLDLRGDLRALPQLVTHWSFYLPVVLSGLAVLLFQYFPQNQLAYAYFGYFAGILPFGAVLLAGFFARRASWLVGILVSVAAVGFLALSLYVQFGGLPDGSSFQVWFPARPDVNGGVLPPPYLVDATAAKLQIPSLLVESLSGGAVFGGLFAASAAWYRRFLQRANPNRARPTTPTNRRPDGKIPRKPQQRPMLARRR